MVEIKGNLDGLQSSIDFYLSIVSMEDVPSTKTLRNHFFNIFQSEDKYRNENFMMYQEDINSNYEIDFNSEPELDGEELDFYSCGFLEWSSLENERTDLEFESGVSVVNISDLENEKNNLEVENTYSENNYESLAVWNALGIPNMRGSNVSEDEESDDEFVYGDDEEESVDGEFSWGSYDEDSDEEESVDESTEDTSFGNWGSFVEDEYCDGASVDETHTNEGKYPEGEVNSQYRVDDYSESQKSNQDRDKFFDSLDTLDDFFGSDDTVRSFGRNSSTSHYSKSNKSSSSVSDELPVFNNTFDIDSKVVSSKNTVVQGVKKQYDDDIVEVPNDLREFVKMYPNCEISFALKFFTKKDIDKQLSLGRVFKRKNRLLI